MRYFITLLLILKVSISWAGDLSDRIQLLPIAEDNFFAGLNRDNRDRLGDSPLAELAARTHFENWKTYSDERVTFKYPDHTNISLTVTSLVNRDPASVEYRLDVGTNLYWSMGVENISEVYYGGCFCGAIIYDKNLLHNGALLRCSFVSSGDVKIIQAVTESSRAVIFEWTHLPITQEVYREIAFSLRLAGADHDELSFKKKYLDGDSVGWRISFLEKGMSRSEVLALLGDPSGSDETSFTYVEIFDDWKQTYSIVFEEGFFTGFEEGWYKQSQLPPQYGSVAWMLQQASCKSDSIWGGAFEDDENACLKDLSKGTVTEIFDRFVDLAPEVTTNEWNDLCQVAFNLFEAGYRDERVLPLVKSRFPEFIDQHIAAWLLHEYDPLGSQRLFENKVKQILEKALSITDESTEEDPHYLYAPYGDLDNLMTFLTPSPKSLNELIVRAVGHPNSGIRGRAYTVFMYDLPDLALGLLRKGLKDESKHVRRDASSVYTFTSGTSDDLQFWNECLKIEEDEEVIKNLTEAIDRYTDSKKN